MLPTVQLVFSATSRYSVGTYGRVDVTKHIELHHTTDSKKHTVETAEHVTQGFGQSPLEAVYADNLLRN